MEKLQTANHFYTQLLEEYGNVAGAEEAQHFHAAVAYEFTCRMNISTRSSYH